MEPGDQRSSRARIRVAVSDAQGRAIAPALARWLARVAPSRARGQVNVAVLTDRRVRALNRQYRGGVGRPVCYKYKLHQKCIIKKINC
jgi:hypothetical protein